MPKPPNCGRCFTPTPAVTKERYTFGQSTYDLHLCDAHADAFRRDMHSWARCGTLAEETPFFTPPRRGDNQELDNAFGTVVASYLHVPTFRPASEQITVTEPVVTVPEPRPKPAGRPALSLVPDVGEWNLTNHALERMELRRVSREDALLAATFPDIVQPGTREGTAIHTRGPIRVVVNPHERRILTVVDRRVTSDQELEIAHG